jgi:hypothetical protein
MDEATARSHVRVKFKISLMTCGTPKMIPKKFCKMGKKREKFLDKT